jgi:predicted dehydrogenase
VGDPIRYGILGTGMMGLEHIRNLKLVEGAVVTAIADPHPTSRQWGRAAAGDGVQVFDDPRALLAEAPVDAVVIASPNHTHASVLEEVFRTRLHVLVEKPLCTTLEDCRRIEALASRHPGVVWVGMEYRYMPPVARLVEEVHAGTAGRLVMLAIREHRFPFLRKVGDWNRFARNTGGTLVEKCCHFFDLMNLIVRSRPLRVYASGAQDVNHLDERYDGEVPDILDNAFAVVDYENGCRALLDLCMFAEASRNEQEIAATGDRGKVECAVPESSLTIGLRSPRKVETRPVPLDERIRAAGFHHGATYYQHVAFAEAIRSGSAPAVSVRDGLRAVALGLAAERSAAEKRPVEMSELGL